MRILIADDYPANLKLLALMLRTLGHEVLLAADGAEALATLEAQPVDAVISDILMPNVDGYRLCAELRRSPRLAQLPVILYSSTYVSDGDRDLALRFGATAFLEKPATPERIADVLEAAVRGPASAPVSIPEEDLGILRIYSERLVAKIEEKNAELMERTLELEASEARFRQIADNIREVFWVTNLAGDEIHYISPAFNEIWGRDPAAIYANPRLWQESVYTEDRARLAPFLDRGSESTEFDLEFRIVRPDLSLRWIRARGFPVRDSHGELYRLVGVAEDITERQSLRDQLNHSQRLEAVGRLAGGIAHDFNNLLTAINGYSQMALSRLDPRDPVYREIDEVGKAGERAAALTRQLLAFSRRQVLQPRVLNLNNLVTDIERLLARLIGEDVECELALSPELGRVRVDPGQMEQVIVNLAVNARDAMPRGGRLKLETRNVELDSGYARLHPEVKAGSYVLLAVTDTGTGMTDNVKAHLFEPFFTTKEAGHGTGLGLATVHGVVRQSGGHVLVYSELDRGTTFKIYLPRTDAVPQAPARAEVRLALLRGDETILLIEDDEMVLTMTRLILEQAGYQVLEARRGAEAVVVARHHPDPIHLALSDLILPGINGLELSRQLRVIRPELRFIFMSGYTDTSILDEEIVGIETAFLGKPFRREELLRRVREVLEAPPAPAD